MTTIDTIKIAVPLAIIANKDEIVAKRCVNSIKITRNDIEGNCIIEFSSKVLLDNYTALLSRDTIGEALQKVSIVGNLRYDIDEVIRNAYILKCDITKDVSLSDIDGVENWRQLKSVINMSLKNYQKWSVKNYRGRGNGIVIETCSAYKRYHKRVTFYDKSHELQLAKNRTFLNSLNEKERVINYFDGKVRIEANLYSMEQIRNYFHSPTTIIADVIASEANPLREIMSEAFEPINATEETLTRKDNDKLAMLKICGMDENDPLSIGNALRRIEAQIRSNTTNVRQTMRHYKMEAYRRLAEIHGESIDIDLCQYV